MKRLILKAHDKNGFYEIDVPLYKCTVTEVGYNNLRYVAIIHPDGNRNTEMYCLTDYDYEVAGD